METRIFKHWRSTVLGTVLLAAGIYLLHARIITFREFLAFLPTIMGLFYVQDTIFRIDPQAKCERTDDGRLMTDDGRRMTDDGRLMTDDG